MHKLFRFFVKKKERPLTVKGMQNLMEIEEIVFGRFLYGHEAKKFWRERKTLWFSLSLLLLSVLPLSNLHADYYEVGITTRATKGAIFDRLIVMTKNANDLVSANRTLMDDALKMSEQYTALENEYKGYIKAVEDERRSATLQSMPDPTAFYNPPNSSPIQEVKQ